MAGDVPGLAAGPDPADNADKVASAARLVIHNDEAAEPSRRWLHPLARRRPAVPTTLRIDDLSGRSVFAIADAGTRVEVELHAGTYLISADRGGLHRGYTIALTPGSSFDLHLHLG